MDNFIRIFDDVIPQEYCDTLIEKFCEHKDRWVRRNTLTYDYNELDLIEHRDVFTQEFEKLGQLFVDATDHYAVTCALKDWQWPIKYGLQEVRMKHYTPDQGEFKPHIDSDNYLNSTRFLSMILYLDDGKGGETEFLFHNTSHPREDVVERKAGRLLCFPPYWTYPHAGRMPIGNDKYIITSYMRYVSPEEKAY